MANQARTSQVSALSENGFGYFDYRPGNANMSMTLAEGRSLDERHKKKVLGLAPRMAFALIFITALIVTAGVITGMVLKTKQDDDVVAMNSTSPAVDMPPPLTIIQAIYAATDITAIARATIPQGPVLIVDMDNTNHPLDPWGYPDPWPGVIKCLSLLLSFLGRSISIFVACERQGSFTLAPNINSTHMHEITPAEPCNNINFTLVGVVWGGVNITDKGVYKELCELKKNGLPVPFRDTLFRSQMNAYTVPHVNRTGVIWYTEDNFQTFKSIFARENETTRFD